MLFGLASLGLGVFGSYEPPRPIFGPEFIPFGQKSVSLSSQQDSEEGLAQSSNPTFSL
eukprot:gene2651-3057_t